MSVLPEHVAVKMRQDLGTAHDGQFKKIYMSRHENVRSVSLTKHSIENQRELIVCDNWRRPGTVTRFNPNEFQTVKETQGCSSLELQISPLLPAALPNCIEFITLAVNLFSTLRFLPNN